MRVSSSRQNYPTLEEAGLNVSIRADASELLEVVVISVCIIAYVVFQFALMRVSSSR